MPLIQISLRAGRSAEQLSDLAARVTRAASEALAAPPLSVRVLITEVAPTHWFVGGEALEAAPWADPHDGAAGR